MVGDGTFLRAQLSGNAVSLSAIATEEVKGVRWQDRAAAYHSGNGTDTVRFKYVVQKGDSTGDLEAVALNLGGGTGYIYKAATKR